MKQHGGKRQGAGRKPATHKTKTVSFRVKENLVHEVKIIVTNFINTKNKVMRQLFATSEMANIIDGQTKSCKCACGESYAIETTDKSGNELEIIVCDACYDNNPRDRYTPNV